MTPKEKAIELYNMFHVFKWVEDDGYVTDDAITKKLVFKHINEIKQVAQRNSDFILVIYYEDVKQEIEAL